MKQWILGILLITAGLTTTAQAKKLYDPAADASADLLKAIAQAATENKHVLIQAGGNWCGWCLEFARFSKADRQVDSLINASYIWYHLNYSKENKNDAIFSQYGFPQRFGFPAFIIIDGKGNRLHTQNSEYLENGKKSYDQKKVMGFLSMWTPAALDPAAYANQ